MIVDIEQRGSSLVQAVHGVSYDDLSLLLSLLGVLNILGGTGGVLCY